MPNDLLPVPDAPGHLPALLARASAMLASATSAGELLEAIALADTAYVSAKHAGRFATAKGAHDDMLAKVHRAQADALDVEARGKRLLADAYDEAQERGDAVGRQGGGDSTVPARNAATAADLGLSRKVIHEGRMIRDAEAADPGIVRRTVDDAAAAGEEPTKAKVRRAIVKTAKRRPKPRPAVSAESQHDRDLRMLFGVWEASCASARTEFQRVINAEEH